MSTVEMEILNKGQNLQLCGAGNTLKSEQFTLKKTLKNGEKIRFKVRYSAELQGFGLLEIFLIKAQMGTGADIMTIPGGSVKNAEKEQEFNIWEAGDYYFLFKVSVGSGKFDIKEYQLYFSAN